MTDWTEAILTVHSDGRELEWEENHVEQEAVDENERVSWSNYKVVINEPEFVAQVDTNVEGRDLVFFFYYPMKT